MPSLEVGKVQVYTGDGKGKTTAALGLCLRALGYGLRVKMVQFVKQLRCSEHVQADRMGLQIVQASVKDPREGARELYELALGWLERNEVDLLVMDEVGEAMRRGYLTREDIEALVAAKPDTCELVLTGRGLADKIGDLADLMTEMRPLKHYFDEGLLARKGIEY